MSRIALRFFNHRVPVTAVSLQTYPCSTTVGFVRAQRTYVPLSRVKARPKFITSVKQSSYPTLRKTFPTPLESSYTEYTLALVFALGAALAVDYFTREKDSGTTDTGAPVTEQEGVTKDPTSLEEAVLPGNPNYAEMPIPQGFLGNLTSEQEAKLRELWVLTMKTFGVQDPIGPTETASVIPASVHDSSADESKKEKRGGLFHRSKKSISGAIYSPTSSPGRGSGSDPEDKYGQTRELQEILATQSPETLREAFWSMVKHDHPDQLLLRFLRARKWDVQRALAMMISTMHWRSRDMHVDDDIVKHGEGGALEDSKSSDASTKKEGSDFLAQLRLGKSFLHGVDKEGRPICFVRVRLHRGGEQSERSLERYTVYVIETTRLLLAPPVETATIVFDMTSFTMANMDYTPVKFMIKVFEANYPESLGSVLVHKAPWIFQGIWKIIKGWLDPVVASKIHFTNNVEELEEFIPKSQIIKELGGNEDWEYKYIEPTPGENDAMKNGPEARDKLQEERTKDVIDFQQKTFEWIHGTDTRTARNDIAAKLKSNYWQLDPYIRARTLYDRTGMIQPGGKIQFYPQLSEKSGAVNGQAVQPSTATAQAVSADDDVD